MDISFEHSAEALYASLSCSPVVLGLLSLINDKLRVAAQDQLVYIPQMLSAWLQTHFLGLELMQSKPESIGSDELGSMRLTKAGSTVLAVSLEGCDKGGETTIAVLLAGLDCSLTFP